MKNFMIVVCLLLIQSAAQANARTITDLVTKCRTETNSLQRLDCYGDIAQKIKKQATVTHALGSKNINESTLEVTNQLGMEHKIALDNAGDKIYTLASTTTDDVNRRVRVKRIK